MKKSKLAFFLSSAVFISSLAFSVVSCGETVTPPDTCEECEECEECPEPQVVTHNVSITENSDCTIVVDKNKAEAGETITVTITGVTEGKMVVSVTCGDTVLAANESNVYTFAMPEKDVAVSATIEDIPVEAVYSISCPEVEGATIHIDKTEAKMGEKVEVQIVPGEGKRVASVKANDMGVSQDTTGKYSFVMPGADVTITVVVEDIPTPTKHEIEHNNPTGATVSVDKTEAAVGEEVEITVEITDSTKRVKSVTAGTQSLAEHTSGKYRFIMPDEYVWIIVDLEDIPVPETYSVKWEAVTGATIEVSKSTGLAAGEEVTVKVTPDDGKTVTSVVAGDMVLGASQTGDYKFAMPAKDVDLVVTVIDTPDETLSVSWATSDDYTIDASATSGLVAGQLVTLSVTLTDSTHVIDAVSANDQPLAKDADTGRYLLTMPAVDVVITVTHHQDLELVPVQLTSEDSTSSYGAHWQDYFTIQFTETSSSYDSDARAYVYKEVTEALPGTTVRVWFLYNSETNARNSWVKQISSFRYKTGTYVYREDIKTNTYHSSGVYGDYYDFTVTSDFIAINPSVADYEWTINYTSANEYGFVDADDYDKAAAGRTVYVRPTARQGYVVTGVTVSTSSYSTSADYLVETTYNSSSNYYTFTMPASNVYVKVAYEAVKVAVGIETDANVSVSNFRVGSSSASSLVSDKVFGPSSSEDLALLVGAKERLYFTVTPDTGYFITSVKMVLADGTESNIGTSGSDYYISSVPSSDFTIKVTSAYSYQTATYNLIDAEGTDLSSNVTLEVYEDNTGTTLAPSGQVNVSKRARLGFVVKTVDTITNGEYSITGLKINGTEIASNALYNATTTGTGEALKWLWFEGDDYLSEDYEGIVFDITLSFNEFIFDADSEFVGDYIGSLVSSSGGSRYMRIRRTGSYAYVSSTSNLPNETGKFAAPAEGSTDLVDSTNTRTVMKSGDYAFVLDSTTSMSSNAILVKGATTTPSTSMATIDGEDMHVLYRQTLNGTATYHLIDLTDADNPVVNFNVTVEGTPFTKGNAVTITAGSEVIHIKFSSSTECSTYVPDEYGGTYTGTNETLGSLTLDGAGGATLSGYSSGSYEYTLDETGTNPVVTLMGTDNSNNYRTIRKFTIDKTTMTYTESNLTPHFSTSSYSKTTFTSPDFVIGESTYRLQVAVDSDRTLKMYIATVTNGSAGSYSDLTGWMQYYEDLSGTSAKIVLNPTNTSVTSCTNWETVEMVYNSADNTITFSADGFVGSSNSSYTITATNMILAVA